MFNLKTVFGTVGDVISGLIGLLGGLVTIGILVHIVFGAGTLGFDIVSNIAGLVNTFTTGGITGLLTLLVVCAMWQSK
jgi:hypothetical protein